MGGSWAGLGEVLEALGRVLGDVPGPLGLLVHFLGRLGRNPAESTKMHKNLRKIHDFRGPGGVLGRALGALGASGEPSWTSPPLARSQACLYTNSKQFLYSWQLEER